MRWHFRSVLHRYLYGPWEIEGRQNLLDVWLAIPCRIPRIVFDDQIAQELCLRVAHVFEIAERVPDFFEVFRVVSVRGCLDQSSRCTNPTVLT